MPANVTTEEKNLIDSALSRLRDLLPGSWKAEATTQTMASQDPSRPARVVDALITLTSPQGMATTLLVEAKSTFAPRDVERFVSGIARQLRLLNQGYPVLVIAPWLSERAQEVLTAEDINYFDLTGNTRIAINSPPLFVMTKGKSRNPAPPPRGNARLKGPKAGRLVRFLLDVSPPYGVSQIASATGIALGYISRLLESLDEDAIIERSRRGQVVDVDVPALIRRWTQTYEVFKSNESVTCVAPQGPTSFLDQLGTSPTPRVAVTGSFSAVRIAPVTAASLLVLYCDEPELLVSSNGLLPSDRGTNVVILKPFDSVVWERTQTEQGITYASVSQTTVDCLTGNGRMPAEGDALLTWMQENENEWRYPSLSELTNKSSSNGRF